jgi:hypothetical protein
MKTINTLLLGAAITALPLYAQQTSLAVKRHQNDVVHYQVSIEGGDTGKVTGVNIVFNSPKGVPANQPVSQIVSVAHAGSLLPLLTFGSAPRQYQTISQMGTTD